MELSFVDDHSANGLEETNGDGVFQPMSRHGLGAKRGWLAVFMGVVTLRPVRRRLFGATEATRGGEDASKQAANPALANDADDDDETTNSTPRRRPRGAAAVERLSTKARAAAAARDRLRRALRGLPPTHWPTFIWTPAYWLEQFSE